MSLSPQKSPVVSEPEISSSLTIVAESAVTVVCASWSLMSNPPVLVVGNVNRPIELCAVAVNCEVIVAGALLWSE